MINETISAINARQLSMTFRIIYFVEQLGVIHCLRFSLNVSAVVWLIVLEYKFIQTVFRTSLPTDISNCSTREQDLRDAQFVRIPASFPILSSTPPPPPLTLHSLIVLAIGTARVPAVSRFVRQVSVLRLRARYTHTSHRW